MIYIVIHNDMLKYHLAAGFSDSFYKVCHTVRLRRLTCLSQLSYQEMVAYYSEGSDNCSRQPLWETDAGGANIIFEH